MLASCLQSHAPMLYFGLSVAPLTGPNVKGLKAILKSSTRAMGTSSCGHMLDVDHAEMPRAKT